MRLAVLGSGSRGNSLVIESGGRLLLIDAGFSCRQIELRMASLGVDADDLEALLLTHEHRDHTTGADVLVRKRQLPLYGTAGTLENAGLSDEAASKAQAIRSGWPYEVAGFQVEAFGIPHDAKEPVGYVIEDAEGHRVGLASDLGSRTQLAWARLSNLDCLVLETNHDLHMLRAGPYPWALKQRVAGRHGHLSNADAAAGLTELLTDRLRAVVLYHLSQTNNLPALAAQAISEALTAAGSDAEIIVTEQDRPSPWVTIESAVALSAAG